MRWRWRKREQKREDVTMRLTRSAIAGIAGIAASSRYRIAGTQPSSSTSTTTTTNTLQHTTNTIDWLLLLASSAITDGWSCQKCITLVAAAATAATRHKNGHHAAHPSGDVMLRYCCWLRLSHHRHIIAKVLWCLLRHNLIKKYINIPTAATTSILMNKNWPIDVIYERYLSDLRRINTISLICLEK